jgi:hypothetical protein
MLTHEDLFRPPDASGQCDGCYSYCRQLWEDPDEPGEWLFCAECIRQGLAGDRSGKPLSTHSQRLAARCANEPDVDRFLEDLADAIDEMEEASDRQGLLW